ncbi:MAG: hypothetical protein AAFY28_08245 [Actinomycetota bacterium]
MRTTYSSRARALAGASAIAVAVSAAVVSSHASADLPADAPPQGAATLSVVAGNSDTTFDLGLVDAGNQICPADGTTGNPGTANENWRASSFILPATGDASQLDFDNPTLGPGFPDDGSDTAFPLFAGPPASNSLPAAPNGNIVLSDFTGINFNNPTGAALGAAVAGQGSLDYELGIACFDNDVAGLPNERYWSVGITVTEDNVGGGTNNFTWALQADLIAPTLNSVVAGGPGELAVDFTEPAIAVPYTDYDVTLTPLDPATETPSGDPDVVENVAGSPATITGLTDGTPYSVTVTANGPLGSSVPSNAVIGLPVSGGAENLNATVGGEAVDPGDVFEANPDEIIELTVETAVGGTVAASASNSPFTFLVEATDGGANDKDGLANGVIVFDVQIPGSFNGPAVIGISILTAPGGSVTGFFTIDIVVQAARTIVQEITVTRPEGVLILTQRCGVNAEFLEVPRGSFEFFPGFPAGLAAVPAAAGPGTSPDIDLGTPGVQADPEFGSYPGPDPATYPTECGIAMGTAEPVADGPLAGQFFTADGVLNQVSVFDTRDTDDGWSVTGTFEDFAGVTNDPTNSFDGNHLGWTPLVSGIDTPTYDNTAAPGAIVLPGTGVDGSTVEVDPVTGLPTPGSGTANEDAPGLKDGRTLGSAPLGGGLGVTTLDARLALLIPVDAPFDDYTATLSLSLV